MAQAKATTPEAVLEAATAVFLEKGYRNTTLDDIAAKAEVSKPTVYRYARGKRWLMDQIVDKVLTTATASAATVWEDGLSVTERLRRLVVVHVEVAMEYGPFFRVAYAEYRDSSPEAAAQFTEWARKATDRTQSLLELAVEEGVLDLPGDLHVYANLLQSLLASLHRWVRKGGQDTAEELADHIIELLSSGRREVLLPR